MSTIGNEDYVAMHSGEWYRSGSGTGNGDEGVNLRNFDIHISSYNEGLRVVGGFKKTIHNNPTNPSGINKVCFLSLFSFVEGG